MSSEINLYNVSIRTYTRGITMLINILQKAKLHPEAENLPSARLISDMKPLTFQVHTVCKMVHRTLKYVLETDLELWEYKEEEDKTLTQLIVHAEEALGWLKCIDPEQVEGKEMVRIELPTGKVTTGGHFVLGFAVPSIFFHLQTVYAILRMKGVPLGKEDFIDPFRFSLE